MHVGGVYIHQRLSTTSLLMGWQQTIDLNIKFKQSIMDILLKSATCWVQVYTPFNTDPQITNVFASPLSSIRLSVILAAKVSWASLCVLRLLLTFANVLLALCRLSINLAAKKLLFIDLRLFLEQKNIYIRKVISASVTRCFWINPN